MKQHITKEQWDEITDKEKIIFTSEFTTYNSKTPNIGQMIEFLGGAVGDYDLEILGNNTGWSLWQSLGLRDENRKRLSYEDELCDALWEAVKYHLNE